MYKSKHRSAAYMPHVMFADPHGVLRRSPISIATGGRAFLEENLGGSSESEARAGAVVETFFHAPHLVMGDVAKVGSLGKILADQTIRVLVAAALVRTARIGVV